MILWLLNCLFHCSTLPHSPLPASPDVCLLVKDLEKGTRPDHEPTLLKAKELLADKDCSDLVDQVISLRELKVEYKPYEAKTSLCHKFDRFLADERIVRLLPKFLGKPFYKRKRCGNFIFWRMLKYFSTST